MIQMEKITVNDRELVKQILAGNQAALQQFIRSHEGLVFSILSDAIAEPEIRRDLAQDVFLRCYRQLSTFRFECKLSTWVAKITVNTLRNYLSKKKEVLLGDLSPEEDWENRLSNIEEDDFRMNTVLEIEQRNRFIRDMVKKMPLLLQTILRLYHWENFSYSEIAEILALPEGTVKSYLFRARKHLKEMLMQKNFLGDY